MMLFDLAISFSDPIFYIGALTGALVGIGVVLLMNKRNKDSGENTHCSTDGITVNTLEEAHRFRNAFESQIIPPQIKGVNISVEQWRSINKTIEDLNGNLDGHVGFRLYFGLNDSGDLISMTHPIFEDGLVQDYSTGHVNTATLSIAEFGKPCPHFCDVENPIPNIDVGP